MVAQAWKLVGYVDSVAILLPIVGKIIRREFSSHLPMAMDNGVQLGGVEAGGWQIPSFSGLFSTAFLTRAFHNAFSPNCVVKKSSRCMVCKPAGKLYVWGCERPASPPALPRLATAPAYVGICKTVQTYSLPLGGRGVAHTWGTTCALICTLMLRLARKALCTALPVTWPS